MLKNIPNILTSLRIILIPILVSAFYIDSDIAHIGENTIMSRIPVPKVQFYLRQPGNVAPDIQVGESPVTVGRGSCPNITDRTNM